MFDGITVFIAITAVVAAIAVVVAVFVVGAGNGGELSTEHADYPPLPLPGRRPVGGTDAALLRLPMGLWGYHQQITDEALWRFAQAITERDTRIAVLEQQLSEARRKLNARRAITAPDRRALPEARPNWTAPDEQKPPDQVFEPIEDDRT